MFLHVFFISNNLKAARLRLAKNQANAKAELLLFANYSHSSSTLSFKNNRKYSKNKKKASVSLFTRLHD